MTAAEKRKPRIMIPKYTLGEELINAISHGVGALCGITALVLCIVKSCNPLDGFKLASSIVFGLSVTLLYLMSCLYHSLKVNKAKRVFRVIDHCTIFLLIAGTYTPFTIVSLRDTSGWWIFGIIWAMAVLGVVFAYVGLVEYVSVLLRPVHPKQRVVYVVMGIIVVGFLTMSAFSILAYFGVCRAIFSRVRVIRITKK